MSPAVVLFDIDGTLIRRAGPHHGNALVEAIKAVTGYTTTMERVRTHGMLDCDIVTTMLREAGATQAEIGSAMTPIVAEAQRAYCRMRTDLRRKVCPGVRSVLRNLYTSGIPLGLVTGNLSAIAWKKMEHAGLSQFFRFGAFAEQAHTRAALAGMAIRQARKAGWLGRYTTVSLVGDHANDVYAAKLNGIRSVAVATGAMPRSVLAAYSPDVLLRDLRCLKLEMLL